MDCSTQSTTKEIRIDFVYGSVGFWPLGTGCPLAYSGSCDNAVLDVLFRLLFGFLLM